MNDEEYDEHIACTEMLSFVEENFLQPEDGVTWTMRRIVTHSRLHPDDPRMHDEKGRQRFDKNCKHIVLIEWEDGQRTWEDPKLFDNDGHKVTVAMHAQENDLLHDVFWRRYRALAHREKKMRRMIAQAQLNS